MKLSKTIGQYRDRILRFVTDDSPPVFYSFLISIYRVAHPGKNSSIVYPVNGFWKVRSHDEEYYTVRNNIERGSKRLQKLKYDRYTIDGFCEVELDDLVVDVGAYVGEFSMSASQRARHVIAIEPDPSSYRCLQKQTEGESNITVVNELPHEESGTGTFKSAVDGSESSVLNVDKGEYVEIQLESNPLDDILDELGVADVDFLKMDAEGAEPEVLRGIKSIPVTKFAIDVGEERAGKTSTEEVRSILAERGYKCRVRKDQNGDQILFAVK